MMILFSSTCFAHNATQEAWDDELLKSILANENECVHHYDEEKIYLNPDKIHPTSQGVYLNLNENEFIFLSHVSIRIIRDVISNVGGVLILSTLALDVELGTGLADVENHLVQNTKDDKAIKTNIEEIRNKKRMIMKRAKRRTKKRSSNSLKNLCL